MCFWTMISVVYIMCNYLILDSAVSVSFIVYSLCSYYQLTSHYLHFEKGEIERTAFKLSG